MNPDFENRQEQKSVMSTFTPVLVEVLKEITDFCPLPGGARKSRTRTVEHLAQGFMVEKLRKLNILDERLVNELTSYEMFDLLALYFVTVGRIQRVNEGFGMNLAKGYLVGVDNDGEQFFLPCGYPPDTKPDDLKPRKGWLKRAEDSA